MTRNQLLAILKRKYPNAWFKPSEEFDENLKDEIWTGEGSYSTDDLPLFDYHAMDFQEKYINGVEKNLFNYLRKYKAYVEWHDAGTAFILFD